MTGALERVQAANKLSCSFIGRVDLSWRGAFQADDVY